MAWYWTDAEHAWFTDAAWCKYASLKITVKHIARPWSQKFAVKCLDFFKEKKYKKSW